MLTTATAELLLYHMVGVCNVWWYDSYILNYYSIKADAVILSV